ncbi:MAG: helix-turn-helix transcriptional regulator [Verrucomicrobiota bacterium]
MTDQSDRPILGERLTAAREEKELTQAQLAEMIGVTQRVISHWERYGVAIKSDKLVSLADALDVTTDYLLGRAD